MSDYQPDPPAATPYTTTPVPGKSPVLSILSLVGGIIGVLLAFAFGTGFIFALAGVILGFIARRREPQARGMWLTGIILGFVGIAISLIFIALFIVAAIVASSQNYSG